MEDEKKVITVGKIFSVAFHRWKLFLCVTLGITLIGSLGLIFGFNKNKATFEISFSYSLADLSKEKYADGSNFNFNSLINYDCLKTVKNSDKKYENINIDGICGNNSITITKKSKDVNDSNGSIIYTIKAASKYFSSYDVAKSFLSNLCKMALVNEDAIIDTSNFSAPLDSYNKANNFEEKINYLLSESILLQDYYQNYIDAEKSLDENAIKVSSESIALFKTNLSIVQTIMNEDKVNSLINLVSTNGFAPDYYSLNVKELQTERAALSDEYNFNEIQRAALEKQIIDLGTSAAVSSLGSTLEKLVVRNAKIDKQLIVAIDKKIDNYGKEASSVPGHQDFVKLLDKSYNDMVQAVEDYRSALHTAFNTENGIVYSSASVVTTTGTINTGVCILISLLIGFCVAMVINLIIDRKLLKE